MISDVAELVLLLDCGLVAVMVVTVAIVNSDDDGNSPRERLEHK